MLDAIIEESGRFGDAYDEGSIRDELNGVMSDVFEREVLAYPVLTGTAANSLSLATLCDPWGGVICSESAHILVDECGAPEFFGGGLRLVPVRNRDDLMNPKAIADVIERSGEHDVHNTPLQVLSITNLNEAGRALSASETSELADVARAHGLNVHLDGARFANAVVATGSTPAELTWRSGVDVMSFGGTKNGGLMAEAVILFDSARADELERRRKRTGQLFSKMRFVTVQLLAQLRDGVWLTHAAHANEMASRLAAGLGAASPDGNELFVEIPIVTAQKWRAEGAEFYDSPTPAGRVVRLVTSWSTTAAEVDAFVEMAEMGEKP